jgi:hypothetical protein
VNRTLFALALVLASFAPAQAAKLVYSPNPPPTISVNDPVPAGYRRVWLPDAPQTAIEQIRTWIADLIRPAPVRAFMLTPEAAPPLPWERKWIETSQGWVQAPEEFCGR